MMKLHVASTYAFVSWAATEAYQNHQLINNDCDAEYLYLVSSHALSALQCDGSLVCFLLFCFSLVKVDAPTQMYRWRSSDSSLSVPFTNIGCRLWRRRFPWNVYERNIFVEMNECFWIEILNAQFMIVQLIRSVDLTDSLVFTAIDRP